MPLPPPLLPPPPPRRRCRCAGGCDALQCAAAQETTDGTGRSQDARSAAGDAGSEGHRGLSSGRKRAAVQACEMIRMACAIGRERPRAVALVVRWHWNDGWAKQQGPLACALALLPSSPWLP